MTIAAGFVCPTGLVLCADTQETRGDIKFRVPKLAIRPAKPQEDIDRRLIMAGAGDASFIDKLLEISWHAALGAEPTLASVVVAIEKSIGDEYARLIRRQD